VGGALGMSTMSGIAAGFQTAPTMIQTILLAVASVLATTVAIATAPQIASKKILEYTQSGYELSAGTVLNWKSSRDTVT
jgi:hypothetical protein